MVLSTQFNTVLCCTFIATTSCLSIGLGKKPINQSLFQLELPKTLKNKSSTSFLTSNNEGEISISDVKNISTKDKVSPHLFDMFGLSAPSPILPVIILILLRKRTIPLSDSLFSIVYPVYLCLANRFRFDRNAPSIAADRVNLPLLREGRGRWFLNYIKSFATVGILIPIILQIIAPASVAEAAAPHLYLTLCQCAMENLAGGPKFYSLTKLMVPVGFNAYRMGSLRVWLSNAWSSYVFSLSAFRQNFPGSKRIMIWEIVGLTLAISNMVLWTYNLFVFLMLRTVPQYLDKNEFPDSKISWRGQILPVLDKKASKI